MNKMETYDLLRSRSIWLEITEHKAVYNMAELADVALPYPSADAKNLFVRDDKKRNYYLITVQGDKRVNLKEFKKQHGTRSLSFASADDLLTLLGLEPGSVTPLGLLHDREHKVQLYLDEAFLARPWPHRRPPQRQHRHRLDENPRPHPPAPRLRHGGSCGASEGSGLTDSTKYAILWTERER